MENDLGMSLQEAASMVLPSANEASGNNVGLQEVAFTPDMNGIVVQCKEDDVRNALGRMEKARPNQELKQMGLLHSANFKPSSAAQKTVENSSQIAGCYAALANRWVNSATASSAGYRQYPDYCAVLNPKTYTTAATPVMTPAQKLALKSFKIASRYLMNLPMQKVVPLGPTVMAAAARKRAESKPTPLALKNPQFNKYEAMRPAVSGRRVCHPELAA